jgi:hypothetical protein
MRDTVPKRLGTDSLTVAALSNTCKGSRDYEPPCVSMRFCWIYQLFELSQTFGSTDIPILRRC